MAIALPAFAESQSTPFLEELEALAQFKATDVLSQSVRDYYAKNPDIARGKHPTLLHDAAIMGSLNLLKYLVKNDPHGIDFAYENGPTPLGYIAGDNQLNSAKILLKAGANPNDSGNTDGVFPLSSAVNSGNVKMIRLLLGYNALIHIGAYYQSPLELVLEKNDIETLHIFNQHSFVLDSMDDELRIILIEYLNSELVEEEVLKILKNHGLDIHAKTPEKPSFYEEYADKIRFSDVKQMLLDVYGEPEAVEQNSEISINTDAEHQKTIADSNITADISSEADTDTLDSNKIQAANNSDEIQETPIPITPTETDDVTTITTTDIAPELDVEETQSPTADVAQQQSDMPTENKTIFKLVDEPEETINLEQDEENKDTDVPQVNENTDNLIKNNNTIDNKTNIDENVDQSESQNIGLSSTNDTLEIDSNTDTPYTMNDKQNVDSD